MKFINACSVLSAMIFLWMMDAASGHESLRNVTPGWNIPSGYLHIAVFNSGYFKDEMVRNPDEEKRVDSFQHFQSGLRFAYAFSPRWELEYKQFIYQDHHLGDAYASSPGDGILQIKYAAREGLSSPFRLGFSLSSRLPLARVHNVILEPFTSDRLALALTGYLSYTTDRLLPESGNNLHFNLSYLNYANTGETVTHPLGASEQALAPTQAIQYGAALVLPSNSFTICFELLGQSFIKQPPETAYGRENYLYFSPTVTFPLLSRINLQIGADLRISSNQSLNFTTEKDGLVTTYKLATYPAWRLTGGLNIEFPIHQRTRKHKELEPLPVVMADSARIQSAAHDSTDGEEPVYEEDGARRSRIKRELTQKELEKIKTDRTERDRLLESLRKKIDVTPEDPKKAEDKMP